MKYNVDFGYDLLQVLLTFQDSDDIDPVVYSAIRIFLVEWGYSVEELESISSKFADDTKNSKLESTRTVFERLVSRVKNDPTSIERLVTQSSAVASMTMNLTDTKIKYVSLYQSYFDLRPSEWQEYAQRGTDLAMLLNSFGSTYKEAGKP